MIKTSATSRLRSLAVEDIMNRDVVQIGTTQLMNDVAHKFCEHDISSAPVIDECGQCIGMLSAKDFLHRAISASNHPVRSFADHTADVAGSFMTSNVLTVTPDTPILHAAEMMTTNHIHRLPVVNEFQQVVGVISTMDVVAALLNAIAEWDTVTGYGAPREASWSRGS